MRRTTLFLFVTALAFVSPRAFADEAEDHYRAAVAADEALSFGEAAALYRKALTARPSASFAMRAKARLDDLNAHAEGDFLPLAELERVRRSTQLASSPEALTRLSDAAGGFPPGRVRVESLLLVAEGFVRRLSMPERGIAPATALLADASADRVRRAAAATLLVEANEALGRGAEARAIAARHRDIVPLVHARFVNEARRKGLSLASWMFMGAAVAAAVVSSARLAARGDGAKIGRVLRAWPTAAVALLVASGGALIARLFDEGVSVRPFLLLGAGVWLIDRSIALVRAAAHPGPAARGALAVYGVAAVAAASFLALLYSDNSFLASFGL